MKGLFALLLLCTGLAPQIAEARTNDQCDDGLPCLPNSRREYIDAGQADADPNQQPVTQPPRTAPVPTPPPTTAVPTPPADPACVSEAERMVSECRSASSAAVRTCDPSQNRGLQSSIQDGQQRAQQLQGSRSYSVSSDQVSQQNSGLRASLSEYRSACESSRSTCQSTCQQLQSFQSSNQQRCGGSIASQVSQASSEFERCNQLSSYNSASNDLERAANDGTYGALANSAMTAADNKTTTPQEDKTCANPKIAAEDPICRCRGTQCPPTTNATVMGPITNGGGAALTGASGNAVVNGAGPGTQIPDFKAADGSGTAGSPYKTGVGGNDGSALDRFDPVAKPSSSAEQNSKGNDAGVLSADVLSSSGGRHGPRNYGTVVDPEESRSWDSGRESKGNVSATPDLTRFLPGGRHPSSHDTDVLGLAKSNSSLFGNITNRYNSLRSTFYQTEFADAESKAKPSP